MADQKISALTAASSVDPDDLLVAVDVSDTTMNASGTNKKATREIIQTYNAGTLTSDKKLLDLSGTWNSVGTTFTGLKLNVTDTASASGSLLLDVQKGGTSQLVLDKSGNLGVGNATTSNAKFAIRGVANTNWVHFSDASGNVYGAINLGGGGIFQLEALSTIPMTFRVNGAERMRLDASGNLGLGVTPSAWSVTALQIKQTGIYALGRELGFVSNVFYDGAWKYIDSSTASCYVLINGTHVFLTAPTGTPGSVATFAERFNIGQSAVVFNEPGADYDFRIEGDTDANLFFVDASTDRVGIGTNAPSAKLDVTASVQLLATLNSTHANAGHIQFQSNGTNYGWIGSAASLGSGSALDITIRAANNLIFNYGSAERMRLDTSGNLLLGGTTSPTTGTRSLSIFTGTAPTATAADSITVYSSDVSAGNTTLSIYTEGTPVSDSTDNAVTKKIAVRINGTLYYLLADTDNS